MKYLFCEDCRDLVRPVRGKLAEPRFCICERHAIWALDDDFTHVRIFDRRGLHGVPDDPAAFVILLSNRLLNLDGPMRETTAAVLLGEHAASRPNLFTANGSLVLRARPGEHPKTAWSDLPPGSSTRWRTIRQSPNGGSQGSD